MRLTRFNMDIITRLSESLGNSWLWL